MTWDSFQLSLKQRLDFHIIEKPRWRNRKISNDMIRDIVLMMIRASGCSNKVGNIVYGLNSWLDYAHVHHGQNKRKNFRISMAAHLLDEYMMDTKDDNTSSVAIKSTSSDFPVCTARPFPVSLGITRYSPHCHLLLTVPILQDIHRLLMGDSTPDAGRLRYRAAYTIRPDGSKYTYPEPEHGEIENMLSTCLDYHNQHMRDYYNRIKFSVSAELEEKVKYIIKCAAWLFCCVITIHPFGNGNGRLCRLLVNQVLSELIPFHVNLYNVANVTKKDYFAAIIESQDKGSDGYLAALLVDVVLYSLQRNDSPSPLFLC